MLNQILETFISYPVLVHHGWSKIPQRLINFLKCINCNYDRYNIECKNHCTEHLIQPKVLRDNSTILSKALKGMNLYREQL